MKIRTIIAPSASGKTTFCKENAWLMDGDRWAPIAHIYRSMQERFGPKWWEGADSERLLAIKDARFRNLRVRVASFGGWLATAEPELVSECSLFVIPSAETLVKHSEARASAFQPIWSLDKARSQVETYTLLARKRMCMVFTSFDELKCVPARVFNVKA